MVYIYKAAHRLIIVYLKMSDDQEIFLSADEDDTEYYPDEGSNSTAEEFTDSDEYEEVMSYTVPYTTKTIRWFVGDDTVPENL